MLKTVFWGNSDFVMPSLRVLAQETRLLAIFTGQDKPFGRNLEKIKIPEPKELGLSLQIPVYQPASLKAPDVTEKIRTFAPDLMVVISYGKFIPHEIYSLPSLGTVNLHASLLPLYRGASPIQQSLLHGDSKTGITIQKINDKLDEGNLVFSKEMTIEPEDQYLSLRKKLSELSALTLKEYLDALRAGRVPEEFPQKGEASYCRKITKEQGRIAWSLLSAEEIANQWRAFFAWPGSFCFYQGKLLKLGALRAESEHQAGIPGEVLSADRNGILIRAREGAIRVLELQPENKKMMPVQDFLNGHRIQTGDRLE